MQFAWRNNPRLTITITINKRARLAPENDRVAATTPDAFAARRGVEFPSPSILSLLRVSPPRTRRDTAYCPMESQRGFGGETEGGCLEAREVERTRRTRKKGSGRKRFIHRPSGLSGLGIADCEPAAPIFMPTPRGRLQRVAPGTRMTNGERNQGRQSPRRFSRQR